MTRETDELVDLVARAEAIHRGRFGSAADAVRSALDQRDRRIAELEEALRPFANAGRVFTDDDPREAKPWFHDDITIGDFRRATVLLPLPTTKKGPPDDS